MKWLTSFLLAMSLSVSGLALAANSAEDIAATIKRKTLTFAAPMWDGYTHTAIPARVIRDNSTKASSQFYLLRNRKL